MVQQPSSFDNAREIGAREIGARGLVAEGLGDGDPGTEVSGTGAAPAGAELRATPRFTLLIRAAKLIADGREFLCILRDASATGFKARLFAPVPVHDDLAMELGNGDRFPIELVWARGDYAGFRFCDQVQVERLLDEAHASYPKRQVRLRVESDGLLHSGGETVRIALHDISQQGASITSDKWLLMNELVRIETGVTQPLYAKVRWRSHPRYGLIFEQTFKLDELGHLVLPLQHLASHDIATLRQPIRPGSPDGDRQLG